MEDELEEKCSECGREMAFAEMRHTVGDYVICTKCFEKSGGTIRPIEPLEKRNKDRWTGVIIALFIILVCFLYYW